MKKTILFLMVFLFAASNVNAGYFGDLKRRSPVNKCKNVYETCRSKTPRWENEYTNIVVKDVPNPADCGVVTIVKVDKYDPRIRYVYKYTRKEAKELDLIDLSLRCPLPPNAGALRRAWKTKRNNYIKNCKIKEDRCRAVLGFKPRYVDTNTREGQILNR